MTERTILLTNDDGMYAPGLDLLAKVASRFGKVFIVAPDRNRSGISSALSLHDILRVNDLGGGTWTCDGTPVDCVLLAVRALLDRRPDWVLSGVNSGFNLGEDVFYSGTVGAAFEGALQGARSAALSLAPGGSLDAAEPWLERFLARWEALELPPNRIWNVNFPKGEPRGFRLAGQDSRTYHDSVERREDPRGLPYYWIGGNMGPTYALAPGSDAEAAMEGWVSVSPLRLDMACPELMARRGSFEAAFNGGGAPGDLVGSRDGEGPSGGEAFQGGAANQGGTAFEGGLP